MPAQDLHSMIMHINIMFVSIIISGQRAGQRKRIELVSSCVRRRANGASRIG